MKEEGLTVKAIRLAVLSLQKAEQEKRCFHCDERQGEAKWDLLYFPGLQVWGVVCPKDARFYDCTPDRTPPNDTA